MQAAPAFDCTSCNRRLGKLSGHFLLGEDPVTISCVHCVNRDRGWNQVVAHGTRAGIASRLGLWP